MVFFQIAMLSHCCVFFFPKNHWDGICLRIKETVFYYFSWFYGEIVLPLRVFYLVLKKSTCLNIRVMFMKDKKKPWLIVWESYKVNTQQYPYWRGICNDLRSPTNNGFHFNINGHPSRMMSKFHGFACINLLVDVMIYKHLYRPLIECYFILL